MQKDFHFYVTYALAWKAGYSAGDAATIAWAGAERLARRLTDDLSAPARARWPLDPDAPPALGAGVKA